MNSRNVDRELYVRPMTANQHIGLRGLKSICGMSGEERFNFLQEGFFAILDSANGLCSGANRLLDRPREADILNGLASEEAAKALILFDLFRCPAQRQTVHLGRTVKRFYSHSARVLVSESVGWRTASKGELREYINRKRRSHILDGPDGDWIMASGPTIERERNLYADVELFEDGAKVWNEPRGVGLPNGRQFPDVCRLVNSMMRLGLFSAEGLRITKSVWESEELDDSLSFRKSHELFVETVRGVESAGLISDRATEDDLRYLLRMTPFPMWDFDLEPIHVSQEDLEGVRGYYY